VTPEVLVESKCFVALGAPERSFMLLRDMAIEQVPHLESFQACFALVSCTGTLWCSRGIGCFSGNVRVILLIRIVILLRVL